MQVTLKCTSGRTSPTTAPAEVTTRMTRCSIPMPANTLVMQGSTARATASSRWSSATWSAVGVSIERRAEDALERAVGEAEALVEEPLRLHHLHRAKLTDGSGARHPRGIRRTADGQPARGVT